MAFHVSRGYSCRRHDLYVLNVSGIDDRLAYLTEDDHPDDQFTCYGDSAYPESRRITCRRDGVEFSDLNKAMNGCRETIEWMYRVDVSERGPKRQPQPPRYQQLPCLSFFSDFICHPRRFVSTILDYILLQNS
jgi:hypothetical protein